jgi:hypothetical protein
MADVQYLPPMGVGQPGSVNQAAGGGQAMSFRDELDAARSGMAGFVPSAAYPDGYLGTIQSRREDRLLDKLKGQVNQRSYHRGVHKGERIDPSDYYWPPELQPDRGLRAQAMAIPLPDGRMVAPRPAPLGTIYEQMVASGGTELPTGPRGKLRPPPTQYDVAPGQSAALRHLAPSWR